MKVWTLHPSYLDTGELTTNWNEGLRALRILSQPRLYNRFRSDLSVFRMQAEPIYALVIYLKAIAKEARRRNLNIDTSVLPQLPSGYRLKLPVSLQRLRSDKQKLTKHIAKLDANAASHLTASRTHPLFFVKADNKPNAWELISRIKLNR